MQDTTSSAMTEVALGLSMAFFTLLIVALLSMSVPKVTSNKSTTIATDTTPEDLKKNKTIDVKIDSKANNNKNTHSTSQFVFYYLDNFYDRSLVLRTISSFSQDKTLIVAVNPQLTFAEVFNLRQKINHPKLSITTSNEAWRARLKQVTTLD